MIVKMQKSAGYFVLLLFVVLGIIGCSDTEEENTGEITALTTNYEQNPIGIDHVPLFGWRMESDVEGQRQTAYRIIVAESQEDLEEHKYVWDSGRTESDISVAVP